MKSTKAFQETIERHLLSLSQRDALFAEKLRNPAKSSEECVNFIINTVMNSGCNGFTDEEIYGMAAHYYQEEDIHAETPKDCRIIVNHQVELTEEEIAEAKEKARQEVFSQEAARLRSTGKPKSVTAEAVKEASLFDLF